LENPKNQTSEPKQTPATPQTEAQTPAETPITPNPEATTAVTVNPDVEEAAETPAQDSQRKTRALALLEAALYVAGRPLNINELGQVLNSRSKKRVFSYVEALIEDYQQHSRALEIISLKDERYVLQVKAEFTPLIKKLVNRPLLSSGPLKTLSYIAYRQPITQKRVIEVRGQHAYGHVKLLKDMGLIMSERSGRSLALKTTDYFADYFGLTQETTTLKKDLRKIFGDAIKEDAAERQQKDAAEQLQEGKTES
jgi:segregation and condensation protein B